MEQNIYNYKPSKESNEETHFLLTKGRINRKSFWLRFFFSICVMTIFLSIYVYYAVPNLEYWLQRGGGEVRNTAFLTSFNIFQYFVFLFLPLLLNVFVLIQAAKRIHDINKSGWYAFIPIYNLVLLFTKGTEGNNNYGVDPNPQKDIKYFDELEKEKNK